MKRKILTLVVAAIVVIAWPMVSKAQQQTLPEIFVTGGPGVAFNAYGKNISGKVPTISMEVGAMFKPVTVSVKYRILMPYSPGTIDSFAVHHLAVNDTANGNVTGAYTDYSKFYGKTSTVFLTVGVISKKALYAGINTGFGAAFYEHKNKLHTFPVWDMTLKGGYNFIPQLGAYVSATYSYLWSKDKYRQDGFAALFELHLVLNVSAGKKAAKKK